MNAGLRHIAPAGALLLLLVLPTGVAAHSEFVSGTPENGATLQPGPIDIVAAFSATLKSTSRLELRDSSGQVVARGAVDGKTMRIGLEGIQPGAYEVRWVSVAEDGDILRSTENPDWKWTFTVVPVIPTKALPSVSATVSGPATPSASPSASAATTAAPSASAPPGSPTGSSSSDALIPIVAALVVIALVGGLLLRRRTPTAR
jgi:methionine-rich copper-binding protein CopC